jgi:chromosome segregation ATPase
MTTTWLHEHIRQRVAKLDSIEIARGFRSEDGITHTAPPIIEASTLELISQVADAFRDMQERMAEFEARAQAAETAAEKLQRAEDRIRAIEAELQHDINEANVRLQEADEALEQAQSRATHAETELCEIEIRLRAAEQREIEMRQALDRVENAIRGIFVSSAFSRHRAAA